MTEFVVRVFNNGVPETELRKVEASNRLEAAEKLCGLPLTDKARPMLYLRADVRTVATMNDHHHFYEAE